MKLRTLAIPALYLGMCGATASLSLDHTFWLHWAFAGVLAALLGALEDSPPATIVFRASFIALATPLGLYAWKTPDPLNVSLHDPILFIAGYPVAIALGVAVGRMTRPKVQGPNWYGRN